MKTRSKSKLKRGGGPIQWDRGGPGGGPATLAEDIVGLVLHSINTVIDVIGVIDAVSNAPADMGVAFSEKGAPNPNDIRIND
jgi:hypothetical protein